MFWGFTFSKIINLFTTHPLCSVSESWHLHFCRLTVTHRGRVTHKWLIIGSDNGLSPVPCQDIFWTNARLLSIRPQGRYFNEISIEIQTVSFTKMHLNVSSAKRCLNRLGLDVLTPETLNQYSSYSSGITLLYDLASRRIMYMYIIHGKYCQTSNRSIVHADRTMHPKYNTWF